MRPEDFSEGVAFSYKIRIRFKSGVDVPERPSDLDHWGGGVYIYIYMYILYIYRLAEYVTQRGNVIFKSIPIMTPPVPVRLDCSVHNFNPPRYASPLGFFPTPPPTPHPPTLNLKGLDP